MKGSMGQGLCWASAAGGAEPQREKMERHRGGCPRLGAQRCASPDSRLLGSQEVVKCSQEGAGNSTD